MAEVGGASPVEGDWLPPASLDEARALARERFKQRLATGERVGACGCDTEDEVLGPSDGSGAECVVGVRFRDSGRVYYFQPGDASDALDVGAWVVVPTARGQEAARVVIAPHQVRRAVLQGELGSIVRRLDHADVALMEAQRRNGALAIRRFGERARSRRLAIKPIAADYTFDGSAVTLSYSVPDRDRNPEPGALRELARELADDLGCRVEMRQVGPRDEARLLGGLGRCGRTLCCASWLPVFPEISMSMAKNQDLPLNPSKVSGVCGRLLCCLSYENEQYRQMKAVMPKLGQNLETPKGAGQVISLHLLKELVTVRLELDNSEVTFACAELGLGADRAPTPESSRLTSSIAVNESHPETSADAAGSEDQTTGPGRKRRRRRGSRRGAASTSTAR
jgi:cell fate regulator YaaT (PSP1 superfamily)